ncbi:DoxX family protein [Streptomyces sp. SA15]|uniref:DoxX family protein n=1 Tax=Streptomyces sp. SA15 TaxID=934019 RepID=UPI0027BA7743|nr:DoxX family protein [Streptomyces sp. SA15]
MAHWSKFWQIFRRRPHWLTWSGTVGQPATDIAPVLTPLAATGLVVVMVLAAITHARRKEPGAIAFNAVLLILAALVAWGRFGPYSF